MSESVWLVLAAAATLCWAIVLLLPWQPWRVREYIDSEPDSGRRDLSDVTVIIPARDEAAVIVGTLRALTTQGCNLRVVLVDDHSSDGTAEKAVEAMPDGLTVVRSEALPEGWSGKLWAQQQGLSYVSTPHTLLLDADIQLAPGMIGALLDKKQSARLQMVSVLATPPLSGFWEKLLMPAFVYFFRLLYPFALVNSAGSRVAAAAGGCIVVDTEVLHAIGGMERIRDAIIDDCSLASTIKQAGFRIWVGLSRSVKSCRPYRDLAEIWNMVARTAFTQLHYSVALLLACTVSMLLLFGLPLVSPLLSADDRVTLLAGIALVEMALSYLPTLRFYSLKPWWVVSLPVVGGLYLLMTWSSAVRYWRGERSRWKGRVYRA